MEKGIYKPKNKGEFLQNFEFGTDFDGIVKEVESTKIDRSKLESLLTNIHKLLTNLGTIDSMTIKGKNNILLSARKAINDLEANYRKIMKDESLKLYKSNVDLLAKKINIIFKKNIKAPNWDKINTSLMDSKFDALHYYLNRSVFFLDQRVTLFELYGQKELQKQVINRILQTRGMNSHTEILNDILKMLDKHYPAGYIPLPIIRNGKREFRKIALDYYVSTWINDVEGSVHHWAQRSTYLKAGIDLVEIHTGEGTSCPICSPEVGKIFSLTGADPDFSRMDFVIPRHPNCDCYIVPAIIDEAHIPAGKLPESYPKEKTMEHDVFQFAQKQNIPFSGFDIIRDTQNPIMSANLIRKTIALNDTPIHSFGNNIYKSLSEAIKRIKEGKTLTFNHHEALESLSHEFSHLKNPAHFIGKKKRFLETLNEWVSRYFYDEFYKKFSKQINQKAQLLSQKEYLEIIEKAHSYYYYVKRLDKQIKVLGLDSFELKYDLKKIVNDPNGMWIEKTAELLSKKSGSSKEDLKKSLEEIGSENFKANTLFSHTQG